MKLEQTVGSLNGATDRSIAPPASAPYRVADAGGVLLRIPS